MSEFDSVSDTHLAGLLRYNCDKLDVYANELRRRGWTFTLTNCVDAAGRLR